MLAQAPRFAAGSRHDSGRPAALMPLLRRIDPERAHALALARAAAAGWRGTRRGADDPRLAVRALGLSFRNPIGLAAGFDKNAVALRGADAARLRLRRGRHRHAAAAGRAIRARGCSGCAATGAVINRMGFNNAGLDAFVAPARRAAPRGWCRSAPMSASTRTAPIPERDYPGPDRGGRAARRLRGDQRLLAEHAGSARPAGRGAAARRSCRRCATAVPQRPPLLVKIAPDLSEAGLAAVVATCVDGGRRRA